MKIRIITILTLLFASMTATAQVDRSVMPKPGETPTINLGEPQTFKMPNGLTLMVVENHKLPRVSMNLLMDKAPVIEGEKSGVSMLTSALMGMGSKNISKDDFNEEIDFLGARVSLSPSGGYAASLTKYFPRVVELMADAALNPNFTQEELDKEKKKVIENLKSSEKSASSIMSRVAPALTYGTNHPYGEFITEETINGITLEDIKKFYNDNFAPNNAYVIVSGDIKADEAKKLIGDYFKNWLPSKSLQTTIPTPKNVESIRIDFVDLPSAVQSEIRMASLMDMKMSDKDYFPLLVANYILGGAFNSYINMNLREKHAFTYGARSSVGADKWTKARFGTSTQVRNAVTDSAVVETLKEIDRIRNEYVDDETLKDTKAKYLGSFIMATENPKTIASYALSIKTQNLPKDFYENYIANIDAVTKEDIKRVANKYFTPETLRIVVVGKGSEIAEALENIEYKGKKIPVYYRDRYGKLIEKPDYSKELPSDVSVKTVVDNYIKAIGGKSKVENVKSYEMVGEAEVQGMKLGLNVVKLDNKYSKQAVTMMGNVMSKQVYNNGKAYMEMQGQKQNLPEEQAKELAPEAMLFPELSYVDNDAVKVSGVEQVNGEDAYVVAVSENRNSYYSVESGLKLQEVITQEAQGQVFTSTTSYEDYKDVDGVKFPFTIKQDMGPQSFEFKMTNIVVNKDVQVADFE